MKNKKLLVFLVKLRRKILPYLFLALFIFFGFFAYQLGPTPEIGFILAILVLTIYLFLFEILPVDVTATTILVVLGLASWKFSWLNLSAAPVDLDHIFSGFSSNAVMSIIAVMIIGASLDRTGVMNTIAGFITKMGGSTEKKIMPLISGVVGVISGFMQNVGAAALFLPVVNRISSRTNIPSSRLLMPMGFCAICGGTITMVGSSPLILLNDLINTSNSSLPADQQIQTFELFSVTPIGIAIIIVGILYFLFLGNFVLPNKVTKPRLRSFGTLDYIRKIYGVNFSLHEIKVPDNHDQKGKSLQDLEDEFAIRIVAVHWGGQIRFSPGSLSKRSQLERGATLAVMASDFALERFIKTTGFELNNVMEVFAEAMSPSTSGVSEIVIPPGSEMIGKSAKETLLRRTFGLSLLGVFRSGDTAVDDMPNHIVAAGDILICHSPWETLERLERNPNFLIINQDYPRAEKTRPKKLLPCLFFFILALYLVIFTDLKLSLSLFVGAVGMILSGVLSVDEAYRAVSWKTVFLLASLIPLGIAVESTGTAAWIAEQTISVLGDVPHIVYLSAIAILATFFTLVMSNVGATVLLVPLAINIAIQVGADPGIFALTVGLATSNSFIIPTHQVNALLMGPGNYSVADYLKAGGIMTILFLITLLFMVNLIF